MTELTHVERPLACALREAGHEIRRQVPAGCGGRADIFDFTTGEIIECKPRGDTASIVAAVKQLRRYRPHFFDPQLAVAVPKIEPDAAWLADMLRKEGIRVIEVDVGIGV